MKIFGVEKFKSLLFAGSFSVLANYLIRLSDTIIIGQMIGSDALAGVSLAAPILSAVAFLAGLISSGTATHYSLEMGHCNRLRARQYFSQGLWTSVVFGGIISLFILFGTGAFVRFMGPSVVIASHAYDYLVWLAPVPVIECIEMVLVLLVCGDGNPRMCTIAYVVNFLTNVVVGVVSVRLGMGASGCALATVVSESLCIMVLLLHFFGKRNSIAVVRHFDMADSFRIASASFGDAAAFLCDALLFFFVNKFVIMLFGSVYLPVVAVAASLWGFLEFFNGIGVAIQPIVTVYYGEGNTKAIRSVMRSAMWVSLLEGIAFLLIFGLVPSLVVKSVGITDPSVVAEGCLAVRLMCVGFLALAFAGLFNSYYMFIERSGLAGIVTMLCYLVFPIASVSVGAFWGMSGVWLGLGLGPFVGISVVAIILVSTNGKSMFPLLLPRDREEKLFVFNLQLTEKEIVDVSRRIGNIPGVPMRVALMVEEVFMVVMERAKPCGKVLLGEATVDLNDGVRLTLRDDGEIFDITDADARISSLRSYLVASVMGHQQNRMNLVTTGFNRNIFCFDGKGGMV